MGLAARMAGTGIVARAPPAVDHRFARAAKLLAATSAAEEPAATASRAKGPCQPSYCPTKAQPQEAARSAVARLVEQEVGHRVELEASRAVAAGREGARQGFPCAEEREPASVASRAVAALGIAVQKTSPCPPSYSLKARQAGARTVERPVEQLGAKLAEQVAARLVGPAAAPMEADREGARPESVFAVQREAAAAAAVVAWPVVASRVMGPCQPNYLLRAPRAEAPEALRLVAAPSGRADQSTWNQFVVPEARLEKRPQAAALAALRVAEARRLGQVPRGERACRSGCKTTLYRGLGFRKNRKTYMPPFKIKRRDTTKRSRKRQLSWRKAKRLPTRKPLLQKLFRSREAERVR